MRTVTMAKSQNKGHKGKGNGTGLSPTEKVKAMKARRDNKRKQGQPETVDYQSQQLQR